ncbi:dipeptidase [Fodinibius halophilus]|uniref:Membrane dipeptidase n=1 Tax=Fodinibius halophilus TaxID=1736908 RepID=A0A6M1SWQ3_9BACT|nr:dipeptidase [Fodinibius halophilus]NGP87986.1 membrane dipeptidase [Fodinibius halophilus]
MKPIHKISLFCISVLLLIGCSETEKDHQQQADKLANEFIIVDGHIDVPYRLKSNWEDISKKTTSGDFDYPRAKEGGLDAPFMSIYIPARYQKTGGAKAVADSLIDLVQGIANDNPNKFAVATTPEEIKSDFKDGIISLPMGMENGAPIEENLQNVQYFYDRGIRYITLAHSKDNQISDSSYDTTDNTHQGLSNFGRNVVKEMNRVGIMVDVSHITDQAFHDVMEVTDAPVVATHSSCRHFTPGFERNMSDELIKKLADNNGVIMINFGSTFLDSTSQNSADKVQEEIAQKIEEKGLEPGSKEARKFSRKYFQDNFKFSTVEKVADHIDHVVELVGIEHVGLGSDYDGVGPTLPVGLKDVSTYPNLFKELLDRGYTKEDIKKIASANIFRVWNKVIEVADNSENQSNSL